MRGYDAAEALEFMLARLDPKAHRAIAPSVRSYLRQMIDFDLRYMRESGVIGPDGGAGDSYYDDDDAFEFMLDAISRERGLSDEQEMAVAALLDDYMELQQQYLSEKGLMDWE